MKNQNVVGLCVSGMSAMVAVAAPTFTGIGILPGGRASYGTSVSRTGAVAGWSHTSNGADARAFRWTAGSLVNLGVLPGGQQSFGHGISSDGNAVVGESNSSGGLRAFRWKSSEGLVSLGTLPGASHSKAVSASGDGSVVVGEARSPDGSLRAFRWSSDTGMVSLGLGAGATESYATGVSEDGSVVVGRNWVNGKWRIFRWNTLTGMEEIAMPVGADEAFAIGTNHDGSVVVGVHILPGGISRGFRWSSRGGMYDLGTLAGGNWTGAYGGVSADGSVIGTQARNSQGQQRAAIWTDRIGLVDLNAYLTSGGINLLGWSLESAVIGADGTSITGWGTHNGRQEAYFATVDPIPLCLSDFNRDGITDFFDYLDFVDAFSAEAPAADFNFDAAIDFFDYLDFVDSFSAGC